MALIPGQTRQTRLFVTLVGNADSSSTTAVNYLKMHKNKSSILLLSVCDGDARSVGGGRGWLTGNTDGLACWPVTVGMAGVCLHCTQGWLGMGTGISAGSTAGILVYDK